MKITFEQLLKGQSDNNLTDILNETLEAISDQKKYYDSPMALKHFTDRRDKVESEMSRRREQCQKKKS